MTRVLVTGGTGVLGRRIVHQLQIQGAAVRVLSRHAPAGHDASTEWAQGDLLSGLGLLPAFAGIDVVVHSATSHKAQEDVAVTRQVLAAADSAGVRHALYISIVGIDTLSVFDYYAAKLEGERLFAASGLPFSIQRATQFYLFVSWLLDTLGRAPVQLVPRSVTLQPVDPEAVAIRVASAALQSVAGRLPDLAGPELHPLEELARSWMRARGKSKPILSLPLPLPVFKAMSSGHLTSDMAERIGGTWETWLAQQPGGAKRDQRSPRSNR